MKFSISVPDDLWAKVHTDAAAGPSETVQTALRALADQRRADEQPLSRAPDQANLDSYRTFFEEAVEAARALNRLELDNGYRFGLLLGSDLTSKDFDALEDPGAVDDVRWLAEKYGVGSKGLLSHEFRARFEWLVFSHPSTESLLGTPYQNAPEYRGSVDEEARRQVVQKLLGDRDELAPGVTWFTEDGRDELTFSETFAEGVIAALKDVRDEAIRRLRRPEPIRPASDTERAEAPSKEEAT